MQILIRAATAPNLEDDKVLDDLLRTGSWLTLMTFAREAARKFASRPHIVPCRTLIFPQPNALPAMPHCPQVDMSPWTRTTYRPSYLTRSRATADPRLGEAAMVVPAFASAPIVRSRTPMGDGGGWSALVPSLPVFSSSSCSSSLSRVSTLSSIHIQYWETD